MWGSHWHITFGGEACAWFIAAGTFLLTAATATLAAAAWRALGQLTEAKSDRHVQVFSDMGRRWESEEMMETLKLEAEHTPESLLELFELAVSDPLPDAGEEAKRIQARKDRSILLRIPNYFEEAAAIQKVGSLRVDLMDD
jgi:hypothetical protein